MCSHSPQSWLIRFLPHCALSSLQPPWPPPLFSLGYLTGESPREEDFTVLFLSPWRLMGPIHNQQEDQTAMEMGSMQSLSTSGERRLFIRPISLSRLVNR